MFTTRTFSANIGDESVLNAGPDAIEQDIDHLLANDAEINNAKINKTDIVNDATSGGTTKVLSAEAGKVINERINTIVYSNVVNDLTTGGADVALSAEQGKVLNESRTSSYLAFCGNVNVTILDAAFGKNNEDEIISIGRQLAMYAWFKGDSKVTYPFTNLLTCNTLAECLNNTNAVSEIFNNTNLSNLLATATFPASLIAKSAIALKAICSNPTLATSFKSLLQSYRTDIVSTLDLATSLFSKQNSVTYRVTDGGPSLQSANLNSNAIIIPTSSPDQYVDGSQPTYSGSRYLYYGADSSLQIWSDTSASSIDTVFSIATGVSMRGIYFKQDNNYASADPAVICDVYTVI